MAGSRALSVLAVLAILDVTAPTFAQEMRVYTTVRNVPAVESKSSTDRVPVVARSLTLFHAGKVYDYVDSVKEVTVFEPAHRRFTLLNERRHKITEVTQDEVRQYLSLVEQEARKKLESAAEQIGPSQVRSLAWLKFQLQPEFAVSFDAAASRLTLSDHQNQYLADGVAPPTQGVVETYLRFADAMAELNSVLHPRASLPRPRLRLNEELRSRNLLPLIVDLRADVEPPLHLEARHKWDWKFQSQDRQLISGWEAQLSDSTNRRMSFRQYQQESLTAEVANNR